MVWRWEFLLRVPHFANGWLSQFDGKIKGEAKLFSWYMETVEGTQVGTTAPKQLLFVQYRGKGTEDFARALQKQRLPVQ